MCIQQGRCDFEYLTVYYTVNGKILSTDKKDIELIDFTNLTIKVDNDYAPNEQDGTDYFMLSVYGLKP